MLVPDILVAEREAVLADRSGILEPGAVRLVVEIVSPGSATMDRLTKPALYARSRIPDFWRVELEGGPSIATFRLNGRGVYVAKGTAERDLPLKLTSPFRLRLDPGELGR
jgi:Uma2 family endonuclease